MSVPFREVNQELSGLQMAREVGLKPSHEHNKFACVACDSSDGLHAYPGPGNGLHCFSCWTSFSAVDLGVAAWGLTPLEVCRRLAERFGIRPDLSYRRSSRKDVRPSRKTCASRQGATGSRAPDSVLRLRSELYGNLVTRLSLGPTGRVYLEGRGLNPDFASAQGLRSIDDATEWTKLYSYLVSTHSTEALEAAGLARDGKTWMPWWDKPPAILIPYFSRTEQIEAIRFRRMTDGEKRYMVPIGAGARIPWRAEAFDGPWPLELVITEGELDALSLLQVGYESIALGGATPSRILLEWIV